VHVTWDETKSRANRAKHGVSFEVYEGDQSENRDDMVRIISARRTTPSEWRRYARSYEG
jgi:uncharacterized DUF497 family protein